ncbi:MULTISPECIES: branched-chain amino acid ABC transporter permease [Eubacteriales]|uniref:branched-chain amino acid ABC transporter permease n=1 Tax=Eubacteriales TaxID=186802 RepID=UPI001371F566|nr:MULTISPECIES: branched-chain amino acid ABC transporter permease [unclassified Neglectibacter]NBI16560.1 branched-chain amino acid ABC transporter permease [Neglectibacter sp. 59]NBJ74098.1 branched-chain amino acid ABC transporter permease [Neglectibacter sp. X4]NCE80287.1 branched-chain amino acid ABC transporter permease [Neglectibacter sp. X58]
MKRLIIRKKARKNFITYGVVILSYIVLMAVIGAGSMPSALQGLLVPMCAYIVAALSLNLTVGVLGELSLGHAGFMSVGAFSGATAAMALADSGLPSWGRMILALIVGAVLAAAAGVIVGVPVLRLQGDYLAIVTLAFGEIIKTVVTNLYIGKNPSGLRFGFLNPDIGLGKGGMMLVNGPNGISGIQKISTLTSGFVIIIICLIIIFNLVDSRTGRAIMALRDNRIAAESVGINATKYKLMAFVISAAMAGAAGALYALSQNTVTANKFDFNTSILILVFVVLGGLGNMLGSIVAATVLYILPETWLRQFSDYRMLIYAVVLILMMLVTNSQKVRTLIGKLLPRKKASGKEGAADA